MADWSKVPATKYGPGSRLTKDGETRFYIPNYNWLRQDTGGKWVSPEGFKKWWADNKPGQEPPDMTRQGVPAGQKPRQPLVKGQPNPDPAPATETAEQRRARERAEIAQRHARQRAELEKDFPNQPRPAAVQADIQQRHAAIRARSDADRIRDRYFYPTTGATAQPKPEVTAVQPKPEVTAAQPTAATPTEKPAVAPGLQQWAKLYGPGGKKQLFKKEGGYTPSQRRLFGDLGMKFEAYDLVLDYLLSEGHADTVDEAHYVMMQLDSEYIQSIVEQQDTILPAEAAFNKSTPEQRAAYKKKYGTPYPPPDTSRRAGGGSNQAPAWMRGGFQSPDEYNKLDPETKALLEY